MTTTEPGWYPDPSDPTRWRWWGGTQWTEHVSDPAAGSQDDVRVPPLGAGNETGGEPPAAGGDGPADPDADRPSVGAEQPHAVPPVGPPRTTQLPDDTGNRAGGQPPAARRRWPLVVIGAVVLLGGGAAAAASFLLGDDHSPGADVADSRSSRGAPSEDGDGASDDSREDDPETVTETEREIEVGPEEEAPTAPIEAATAPNAPFWTVIIESLDVERYSRADAEIRAERYRRDGIADVAVLNSGDFGSLNPGYWAIHAGTFNSRAQARDFCESIADLVEFCYDRLVDDAHSGNTDDAALNVAQDEVRSRGYEPADVSGFQPSRTLQVIVGHASNSPTGRPQFAFFFVDGEIIGTDTSQPSSSVSYASHEDDVTVRITYGVYRPEDADCCPSSFETVRYRWSGGSLTPLDPIPTNDPAAPRSRR